MKLLFKKEKSFFLIFLCILLIDLVFTNNQTLYPYRYATKLWIVISLGIHFYYNNSYLLQKERTLVWLALFFSFIADIILITDRLLFVIIGMIMFLLVKICYATIFYFKARFDIDRLIPFLAVILLYSLIVIYYLYDGVGKLFLPVVIYIFVSLTMTKLAYLRYKMVNNKSYRYVMIGAILFITSETYMSFYNFYKPLPYTNTLVILTYGLFQFFIIRGIILQNKSGE
ncbi:lysoplasmalogenase [Abyssalbus ytuae]|uniref:Lysoplasmalogenase n=1 Tax=Abyssalbus ytuae TaxID=2926907 RepID=A0A9E7CUD7_9FLAO|nr:lysoplasmalogenase [Abyssalbus ytuae]UOB18237.1 lysoplasmalogenase [Abyssalbus ytuae]